MEMRRSRAAGLEVVAARLVGARHVQKECLNAYRTIEKKEYRGYYEDSKRWYHCRDQKSAKANDCCVVGKWKRKSRKEILTTWCTKTGSDDLPWAFFCKGRSGSEDDFDFCPPCCL
jgi:hypothetical protein